MTTPQNRPGAKPDPEATEYADAVEIDDLEAAASDQEDAVGGASGVILKLDGTRDY
jgi:hypothetical protein